MRPPPDPTPQPRRRIKVPRVRPVAPSPPAGDIGSSGGDYGMREAKRAAETPKVKRNVRAVYKSQPVAQRQAIVEHATGPTARTIAPIHEARARADALADIGDVILDRRHEPSNDLQAAAVHLALERRRRVGARELSSALDTAGHMPHVQAPEHHGTGTLATALNVTSKAAPGVAAAAFPAIAGTLAGIEKLTGAKTGTTAKKIAQNVPLDAAELAVTTPSSVAKLASTAVHDPTKVPGMVAEPYKQLYHDPGKFVVEHPVSTFLMLDPAVKVPGRVVGRVARVGGKQTLERASATLPGTGLREARTGSRDIVVRAVQARKDAKAGTPTMTDAQVQKRVDEFYDVSKQHRHRVMAAATRQAKERFGHLPKDERAAAAQEHIGGSLGRAENHIQKRFAEEFGSTYVRTPEGIILKPKHATKGVLHDSKADADAIAGRVPFDAVVRPVGEKYAVVPRVAAERFSHHRVIGSSGATGAKVLRTSGKLFRGAVLPGSMKWLAGQVAEAGVRSGAAGAGPMSLLREHRAFKAMEAHEPGSGIEMRQRTSRGGQFGLTGTAREFAEGGRTLGDEFKGTSLGKPAAALTKAGKAPGISQLRTGWHAYSSVVFDVVNGAVERTAQRAMAGKAMKNSPLMERHVLGVSDKAIQDAAHGLHGTENQVALGRAVDRMYGSYSKFSPEKREALLHWTPFYPWYRNAVTFLVKVLPVDHPVLASVVASANVVEEDWRKAHHLSLLQGDHVPSFLLGSAPVGGDKYLRAARYTPFGAFADPAQSAADLFMPQFSGAQEALRGIDWTGHRLKDPGYAGAEFNLPERVVAAADSQAEAMIPGVGPAARITGLGPRYAEHKDVPTVLSGKPILPALRKEYDPLMATGTTSSQPDLTKVKLKPIRASSGNRGRGSLKRIKPLPRLKLR